MNAMTEGQTTMMSTMFCDNAVMSGDEVYPIVGNLITEVQLAELMAVCKGLRTYWDCIRKAYIVKQYLGCGIVVGGKMMVASDDMKAAYGYYWNPPFELHAWWQYSPEKICSRLPIIDIALPGVILKGLTVRDDEGPVLVGRKPVVLAGPPQKWMLYEPRAVIDDSQIT